MLSQGIVGKVQIIDAPAGSALITVSEALLLAAWREGDLDMLAAMVNSRTGATGLKLFWHDPLIESDEPDGEPGEGR